MKRLIFLILIFHWSVQGFSQKSAAQQVIEDILESAGEEISDETDIQEILDDLGNFSENPLKINVAGTDELVRLHLLSEMQINNLIDFRKKTGILFSIYEMAAIDGFSPDILEKIEPFISFGTQLETLNSKRVSNDILLRTSRAFPDLEDQSKYEGSLEKYYLRIKHISANLEYGLVGEKDAGEAFFRKSNKYGFDYNSGFVNFGIGKSDDRVFVGDFRIRFGQGLVAWQGFSTGKSSETTQIFRSGQGVSSYSSTDENQFFRGAAGKFNIGKIRIEPFFSFNKVDASVDTVNGNPFFGALQTSGYHRTTTEIANENSVQQISGGGHVSYIQGNWSLGLTGVYNHFNKPLIRDDQPYNWFLSGGCDSFVGGLDWKGSVGKLFFFGEAAANKNSGKALLAGISAKPSSNSEISAVYRTINKTYFSFFANAFTESTRANDENGLYLGLKIYPAARWSISAYADFFRFRWIKYTTAAPSNGTEFFTQVSFTPSAKTNIYLRFFQEEKGQRVIDGNQKYNDNQLIDRVRINFSHDLNEQITLKSRFEYSFYSKVGNEHGFLVLQDVSFKPTEKRYSINGRIALFYTDGYNSRLYAYENDVLYSFSVPPMYGKGIRSYLNYQQKIGQKFTVWLKLGTTYNFPVSDESETTASSIKSEIKLQVRYQF